MCTLQYTHTHMIASDITYYISSVKASVNSNLLGLCSFFDVNDLKLSLMYLMDQKYLHMAASDTFLKDYIQLGKKRIEQNAILEAKLP